MLQNCTDPDLSDIILKRIKSETWFEHVLYVLLKRFTAYFLKRKKIAFIILSGHKSLQYSLN